MSFTSLLWWIIILQVEHLQKMQMWWSKQVRAWKNVNNLQKQMKMFRKELQWTSVLDRREMKDNMKTMEITRKEKNYKHIKAWRIFLPLTPYVI
jgi:hypothetical protein